MTWACMAANGTGSLVFIDDVTADRSSRMNSEVYRAVRSAQIQSNATKPKALHSTDHSNDAKHTAKAKLKAQRPTNKQQLKAAAVKAWQSIKMAETQHLVMSMFSRLQMLIECKGFVSKHCK